MDWQPLDLRGCFHGKFHTMGDPRGSFNKVFHKTSVEGVLPRFEPREVYVTQSIKGVLRGMHFQLPPHAHGKIVTCLSGRVLDVLLDLRAGPDFGRAISLELTPETINTVVVPKGCAHGFLALEESAALAYTVETEHAPDHDAGIAWDSFDFDWPVSMPILSKRDMTHPKLSEFSAPRQWENASE